MTPTEQGVVADAVEDAWYWLSRDGKYTSEDNWRKMMAKLEKAHGICSKMLSALAVVVALGSARAEEAIDYDALVQAMAIVESDDGATSRNVWQITPRYWADVNRIRRMNWHPSSYAHMVSVRAVALDYMAIFWAHYGERYTARTGKPITAEVLAKMHRVGYEGIWRRPKTAEKYWRRVRKHYDALKCVHEMKVYTPTIKENNR